MNLKDLLSDKRSSLIKKWRNLLIESYPAGTRRFLKSEKDQFANPVGHVISKDIEILFDEFVHDGDIAKITASLENILRIRAVQDMKPSHALAFVLQFKGLIREELKRGKPLNGLSGELQAFERKIDDLVLLAFDVYTNCRQRLYEIRVREVKEQYGKLLERTGVFYNISEQEPSP
ncbi:MAG: hypothetical protein DRN37_10505 [Thermoplasmata archaeon]|nr:MAG: hypothetical protein DRN37_10505 [Thermoplasmata archaeon]